MKGLAAFTKRLIGGPNRILWSEEDISRLAKIYGISDEEAAKVVQRAALPSLPIQSPPVSKSAPNSDLPIRWKFTASDGRVDRVGDIVDVAGIKLDDYRRNPLWTYMHAYDRPIGHSVDTEKVGGKLKSVLELAVGILPDADMVQNMLVKKVLRACSISFKPIRWTYDKSRDGVNFHEVSLIEIAAVTVPCCAGAVLDGPVKSAQQERLDLVDKIRLQEKKLDLKYGIADAAEARKEKGAAPQKGYRYERYGV